jgi:protein-L-isoaspartate(D-aspartate) O-methyltransferase
MYPSAADAGGGFWLNDWTGKAKKMVRDQIIYRGLAESAVTRAMEKVPRHLFVPLPVREFAYEDRPLPIGFGQTISQPWMVASMTALLEVSPGMKVLEIGTGSGYHAAILAFIGARVFSIERLMPLVENARKSLESIAPDVRVYFGDGRKGYPSDAPFDRILITAATDEIPAALFEQTREKAIIVAPVRKDVGAERLLVKRIDGILQSDEWGEYCRFVPLLENTSKTGEMI